MKCKICDSTAVVLGKNTILKKYLVEYYRCPKCGFIQTEQPYWLDEAYSDAIADADIGLPLRNVTLVNQVGAILKLCLSFTRRHLDFGGGYGLFVRLMRDAGFNFEWYDKYCQNLFAKGFEKRNDYYDVVTAFELFEHIENPVKELEDIFNLGSTVICTTALVPSPVPKLDEWWYFAPSTGQHISFYTEKSMKILGDIFKKKYINMGNIHVFTNEEISQWKIEVCKYFPTIVNKVCKRKSLLPVDYKKITGHDL